MKKNVSCEINFHYKKESISLDCVCIIKMYHINEQIFQ